MKTNQLLRRPARMAASLTAFVLTFMLAILPMGKVYAGYTYTTYIHPDLTDVKIGDLYYDLNTKTRKAAVTYQHNSGDLENYKGMTNVVIPSKVKFQIALQEEIEYDVVEIGEEAFGHNTSITSITIPSSIICISSDIWGYGRTISAYYKEQNPDGWYNDDYYLDGCLVYTKHDSYGNPASRDNFYIKEGTRLIASDMLRATHVHFPEGKIILSLNVQFTLYANNFNKATLWGTTIDGYLKSSKADNLTIYNYSGKIDYTTETYNSLKTMYVTRDVARYHTSGNNAKFRDKVELFHFKEGNLYYELLNKDEAVVVYDDSYASLSTATIPATVKHDGHTFKVTKIEAEAFKNSSIVNLTIPSSIKEIGEGAFTGCTKLANVTLADEITTISKRAFENCTALKELHLNNVANIASEAFKGCTKLTTLFSDYQGVINAHSLAFDGLNKGNITVQVASSLMSKYKADAFWKNFNIASNRYKVDGLWYELQYGKARLVKEKSGEGNYSELTGTVTVPKDVIIDGKYYTVSSIEVGAFQYAPITELDVRAQVTTIPEGFCFGAKNLSVITLPETTAWIGDDAFNSCPKLWRTGSNDFNWFSLSVCKNLYTIGASAFAGTNIKELILPESLTTIGEAAFMNCKSMIKAYIRSKVSKIGKYAFQNCTNLEFMENDALTPQPFTTDMLYGVNKNKLEILVEYGALNAFKTADGWKDYKIFAKPVDYPYYYDEENGLGGYLWYWIDLVTHTATLTQDFDAEKPKANYAAFEGATIEIPEKLHYGYEEITVTGIDKNAFWYAPIKKVIVPETVKKIDSGAFYYTAVEEVQLPENVASFGEYVFCECSKLKSVNLPTNLSVLPAWTFQRCPLLEHIVLPDGLQEIGALAFDDAGIRSITIPDNVTKIGDQAFKSCTSLYEIYNLASTPQTIDSNVFEGLTLKDIDLYVLPGCKDKYAAADVWKEFNIKEMNVQVGDLSYRINPSAKTAQVTYDDMVNTYTSLSGKVTVPASITYKGETYAVTGIYNYAFQGNTTITEIVLPDGIKTIGWDCFDKMTKLTSLNIPSTVETMDRFVSTSNGITANDYNYKNGLLIIDNCLIDAKKDLDYIVHVPDGTRMIAGSAFQNCKDIIEIKIPESVKEIGSAAFSGCKSLGQITLPEGLKVLRKNVFYGCERIGSYGLTLPESLEEIEEWAFGYNCKRLEELHIPANVRKIGKMAFQMSAIKKLWLPEGIQEIGNTAFAFLDLLEDVYCYAPDPTAITLGTNVFQNFQEGAKLHVPYGSAGLYAAAEQWKDFDFEEMTPCIDGFYYILDKVNHTATLTYELVSDMYSNYTKLNSTRWTIPAKVALDGVVYDVKTLGDKAFYQTNVSTVILPEGLESIGDDAFADTYEHFVSLEVVILPSTLTSIGEFAFYNCRNLKNIYNYATTPQDISGKGVFADGTYGTIDKSKITLYVPYGCKAAYEAADEWKDFVIEEMSVCINGVYYALNEENGTASVTYQYFDDERNYADLYRDELIIPAAITVADKAYEVTSIGDGAFAHSKNIQVIVLPEGLKRIKDSAFGGSALTMVYLPSTLTEIDPWTFAYCENPVTIRNFATEPLAVADFKYFTKGILEVPAGCKEAYEAADVWKDFTITEMDPCIDGIYYSIKTGNATVTTDYTGHNYSLLGEEIEIPEMITVGERRYTVTHIINHAFFGNTVLKKLTLPAMLNAINFRSFSGCTSLREIINHRTAPAVIDATVFDGLSKSACTLFVHRESVEAYKSADEWKDFNIVSIETPIMIAGQPIRSDMYGKPLTDIKGVWGVVVTSSGIYLDGGGSIYTEDVPAIELYADGITNNFFIGGKDAHLYSTGSPAIRVSGNTPVTLNLNTHLNGDETTEGLDLRIDSDSDEGAIAFANGMEVTLYINSTGQPSTNVTNIVASTAIGIPPSAHCDIHAAGEVGLVSNEDICPIGVFDTRSLTLHGTTVVLPYGGDVKDEGIFDAYGNDCFRLHLSPVSTQSGKAYPVELGGITVTDGNKDDILGDGKASYEPSTNTLTLEDINVTDTCGQVLKATAGLRLEVKGWNSVAAESKRPTAEVQGGDFVIFGSKDSWLRLCGSSGVQCDQTEQYRMEVKRCNVEIYSWGCDYALQTDSLCVNAAYLELGGGMDCPLAWLSWNTADDGGLVLKHANKTYGEVNQDEYMVFERQDPLLFKVDVAADDEDHGSVTGGGWYEDGQKVTLTATAKEAYKFARWDDGSTDNPRELTVDDDYTLKAVFVAKDMHTVTFLGFGGTAVKYEDVYDGAAAHAPELNEIEGWHFVKWDTDFSNVTSDLTVTAIFERNTYTVTFLAFDGVTVLKTEEVEYGDAATAPVAPTVEHYTFTGWDTNDYTYVVENLTVNPVYEIDKFTVMFIGLGEKTLSVQTVPYGGAAEPPVNTYEEGYTFTGWDKEFNYITEDLVVAALYESNIPTYTLTLETEGEGKLYFGMYNAIGELQEAEADQSTYPVPEGSQFLIIAKPAEGWVFVKWSDGETKAQRPVTMKADLTLKAIFEDLTDGIEGLQADQKVQKVLINGRIYILRDGHKYETTGLKVK